MEIILLQDIEKLGEKHSVVSVKNGYGRNYLIPKRLGLIANKANLLRLDDFKKKEAEELEKLLSQFREISDKISGKTLKIGAKAGTTEKIFGSVTNIQIAQALKDQLGVELDRKIISIEDEIKSLGSYTAIVNFHPQVQTEIQFEVVPE